MSTKDSQFCQCLYFAAGAFARRMNRLAEEAFAPAGIAPSYAFVLMAANRKPGISPTELSNELMLTPSTITRLVEKLEAKGLAERRSVGRGTEVYPTAKSAALDAKLRAAWSTLYRNYTELLGEEAAKELTVSLFAASKKLGE